MAFVGLNSVIELVSLPSIIAPIGHQYRDMLQGLYLMIIPTTQLLQQ